ncbi:flagellar motor switch protein FliG [Chromatocurvus halotolerans]|uniref:Flagellar motor switch protein FliG n=1 Tax=Chromatocurvus halotolerans TaxID=1132028 RepID=A0A4R2KQP9_9GAMM|nr:flagellar motor switch protein FliG [Chromatocurvus halotolerans]TCO76601.1 flagellar motor switch protein FliG [Chromatocurvus halotolerans]
MSDEKKGGQEPLSGVDRAAILLMSLGEQEASTVLKHMGAREVQKIGNSMASLSGVSRDQVNQVLDAFITSVEEKTSLGVGSDDYVRRVMQEALGDKASNMIDRILLGRDSKGLESLKWMDARSVADMIRQEHPQIIAIVLSYLDSDQAAEILSLLPERARPDVVMRIATLDGIPPSALSELDDVIQRQSTGSENVKSSSVGGVRTAAEILNLVDGLTEQGVLDAVRKSNEGLSQRIQDEMFVFENLADIDDRGIQTILREVQTDLLVVALKGADQTVKDKLMKNMSRRAAEMLNEDLEAKGPVRLAEVEAAQKEILGAVRNLADQGQIELGGKGDEYV